MTIHLSSNEVWDVLEKELFAVLGMATVRGEARTVGVVYVAQGRKIYIVTGKETWKARHVRANPHVSITVPIAKRIPFMPWIKIPAATITFCGTAAVLEPAQAGPDVLHSLLRGLEANPEQLATMCIIEIEPQGEFITYGIGIPLMSMRFPEKARGRAPVASEVPVE